MLSDPTKIRVLVVDDSAVMRKLITSLLEKDPEIEVVATAIDGNFAINKVEQLNPDVVTLDVDMPRVDGLTALKEIVAKNTVPVVMLSSLTTRGARLALQALEMGAVDIVGKPKAAAQIGEVAEELILKVKTAARIRMPGRKSPNGTGPLTGSLAGALTGSLTGTLNRNVLTRATGRAPVKLIAIGASSGGPNALRQLLPKLPADFPVPIVVVQHLPESFTEMFAKWLDEKCEIKVQEAHEGTLALPGTAIVAPGKMHLKVRRRPVGAEMVVMSSQPVNGHMPSVDVLFRSVAEEYGENGAGVLMTGMGSDGSEGIGEIQRAGGFTMAQDKESCMIFGMPRVAISKGYIDQVVPLKDMASCLISAVGL